VTNSHIEATAKTTVNRMSEKATTDRAAMYEILDAGLVAHMAWADDSGQPYIIPIAYARDGDRVLVHGSTGAGMLRKLAAGAQCCFSVTLTDAMVLARSAFESSMHYRSVVAFGKCEVIEGDAKVAALDVITEKLLPGRTSSLRPPLAKEIAATLVLALPLTEMSAKTSHGQPDDPESDITWPVWAGYVPMTQVFGTPVPADNLLPEFSEVPDYINRW